MKLTSNKRTRSWLITGALLGGTLVVGAAAQHEGSTPVKPLEPIEPVTVAAHGVTMSGKVDKTAVLAGSDGRVRMELVVRADKELDGDLPRVPSDLVVVLDRSGSMDGQKLQYARAAVHQLIQQLDPRDRFALVTYSDSASTPIHLTTASPTATRSWQHVVNSIASGGGTNMSLGMDVALGIVDHSRLAGRAPRVIVISDGLANQGDATFTGLRNRGLRASRGEYVLSTIGVGHDFNEELMTAIADAGTGNYYFLENLNTLAQVFRDELDSTRETVASGLAVRIQPNAGITVLDAGGYPLQNDGGSVIFRPGALFAGQERHVWVTLRVPTSAAASHALGDVSLTFKQGSAEQKLALADLPEINCVRDEKTYLAAFDRGTWEQSVAQDEYNELQWNVSRMVREGKKAQALQEIESFNARNMSLNANFGSTAVSESIEEADKLKGEVEDAFDGANQQFKQNKLSKTRGQDGYVGRRVGQRRR